MGLKYPQHCMVGSQSIFCHYQMLQAHLLFSLPQPCLQPFILLWANDVRIKIWVQLPLGVIASSSSQETTRQCMYSQFSLFLVGVFYEVAVNMELVNREPLLIEEMGGLGFWEPLVTTFLSADQCITSSSVRFCLKTPHVTCRVDSLTLTSRLRVL